MEQNVSDMLHVDHMQHNMLHLNMQHFMLHVYQMQHVYQIRVYRTQG